MTVKEDVGWLFKDMGVSKFIAMLPLIGGALLATIIVWVVRRVRR